MSSIRRKVKKNNITSKTELNNSSTKIGSIAIKN